MSAPTIGIDVGGTKIAGGAVAEDGAIVGRRELRTESGDPSAIVAAVVKVVREMRAVAPAATAVGIGAAGLVDSGAGVILGAPNLSYRNLPLASLVAQRGGLPCVIDNDANVAALAEAKIGAGRGHGDQIMVTVGTGVGGGIVIGDRIYRGAHGIGAELGHVVVCPSGPVCGCGNRGCLEAHASGTAIGRIANEGLAEHPESLLTDLGEIDGAAVGAAAAAGDAFAIACVREAGRWLGIGLAGFVNVFDPEVVIVGGGVTEGVGDLLLEPARAAMREHVIGAGWRPDVQVIAAALGNDAGLVGAALLARSA